MGVSSRLRSMRMTEPVNFTTPRRIHGAIPRPRHNIRLAVTGVPGGFPDDDPRSKMKRSPTGAPGEYTVVFVLAVPGKDTYRWSLDAETFPNGGESLLLAQPGLTALQVDIEGSGLPGNVAVVFRPNAAGMIANATATLTARDFATAERIAYDLVTPILSWLSFRYDVAIDLAGWLATEVTTGSFRVRAGVVGQGKLTDNSQFVTKSHYRTVMSAYREGLNATNVFYQVLCFYKVIEASRGLRASRKNARGAASREHKNESIPVDLEDLQLSWPDDSAPFAPYAGKRFGWVIDQLRPVMRNAIAHLDPTGKSGQSLSADKFDDVITSEGAVPVLKHMARIMLTNELRADPEVAEFLEPADHS